jgi:type I restriction enzyme S subunit
MVREGYKQTEVGVIPEDWEPKSIGEMLQIGSGFSFKSEFFSTAGPIVLTPGNFKLEGGLYFNDRNTKRYSGSFPKSTVFQTGDLLVVMTDLTPDCNLLGKPAFLDSEEIILHNQRIGKVNLFTESLDKQFLYFLLLSPLYLQKIKEQATGSTVRHTSNKSIYSVVLPIPLEIEEQQAIAQTLSDVDALIASLDKLIAKQRHLKTATMQQLLTGKKRLPGFGKAINNEQLTIDNDGDSATSEDNCQLSINNYQLPKGYKQTEVGVIPDDWDIKQLGQVLQIKHGKSQHEVVDPNGTYPILATGGEIGRTNTPLYSEPSVLIGRKGTIDIPYYMDTPFWTVDTLFYSEIFKNADPKFIFYKFNLIDWHSYNEASGVPSLNATTIENIDQAFPAQLEEQRAIATVLSDMDAAISALETRRAKTQAIKQGMMQELLTGKTRLINNE